MPVSKTTVLTGGDAYPAVTNQPVLTLSVTLDVSSLDSTYVDSDGVLLPGVPLVYSKGNLAIPHPGRLAIQTADTTGDILIVSGDQQRHISVGDIIRVLGSTGNDGMYQVAAVSYDSTNDETDITVEGSISDGTGDGNIRLDIQTSGVVHNPIEVADGNSASDLNGADDIDIAIAAQGVFLRSVIEDLLGRGLDTAELDGFEDNDALILQE